MDATQGTVPFMGVDDWLIEEGETMAKGRIVKVRFPDNPPPNVNWCWFPVGNCGVCRYYAPPGILAPGLKCVNPKIADRDVWRYIANVECPEYEGGVLAARVAPEDKADDWRIISVMRVAGLAPGKPLQRVDVLQNLAWTPERSHRAHQQQAVFEQFAIEADAAARAGRVHGLGMDEVDHSDDLGDIEE